MAVSGSRWSASRVALRQVRGADRAAAADTVTLAPGAAASIAAETPPVVAANIQLTPLEALAVSVAAQTAATQQTSLAQLFANLGVAAGLNGLPPQVQQAAAQVLAQQTSLDQNLTGEDIKQAFQTSGLFLEASLASGSVSSSGAAPDLKAALIVLRQVLTTSLDGVTATPGRAGNPKRAGNAARAGIDGRRTAGTDSARGRHRTGHIAAGRDGSCSRGFRAANPPPPPPTGTAPAAIVLEQGAQLSQASLQPVTITITLVPQMPATALPRWRRCSPPKSRHRRCKARPCRSRRMRLSLAP